MNSMVKAAMKIVVAYLDRQMEDKPTRELADTSNYLQRLLDDDKA